MNLRHITWVRRLYWFLKHIKDQYSFKNGRNNLIHRRGVKINSKIQIQGNDNFVLLAKGSIVKSCRIKILGHSNQVIICEDALIDGVDIIIEGSNCLVKVGRSTYIGHHSHLACTEDGSQISIGESSMISSYVQVRTGDSHSILDVYGLRINPAKSVFISDHCWIGEGARVLKGVRLGMNCVVSTGAIITKSFGNNLLLGGIPAKVLKENINWDKDRF